MKLQVGKMNYRKHEAVVYAIRYDKEEDAFITHTYDLHANEWYFNDYWSYDYDDFEPNLSSFDNLEERKICLVKLFL